MIPLASAYTTIFIVLRWETPDILVLFLILQHLYQESAPTYGSRYPFLEHHEGGEMAGAGMPLLP